MMDRSLYLKLLILSAVIMIISGCSTLSSTKPASDLYSITAGKTYHVRVRSGNLAMDRAIYNYSMIKFRQYLRIDNGPSSGLIEIVFSGNGMDGPDGAYISNMAYGNSWYSGDSSITDSNYYPASGTEMNPGSMLSWQNGAMAVTIKNITGEYLWNAQLTYRGALDTSRSYIQTADEAARISIDRIVQQFEKDYIFITENKGANIILPAGFVVDTKTSIN